MKKIFQKWLPPFLMLAMALWFFGQLQPPKDKDFAFDAFGKLPVVFNGRLKPMDSLARTSLLQLREKQTLNTEPWRGWNENPRIISATEWLANVMMNPQAADNWPVFRVDNPDLIAFLKLPEKNPGAASGRQTLFVESDQAVARRRSTSGKCARPDERESRRPQRLRARRRSRCTNGWNSTPS
jgi:hypothetical protein